MAQQTAVQWLVQWFEEHPDSYGNAYNKAIEKALEMEKTQIVEAWIATDNELQRIAAEEYYYEKYKKK